MYRPLCDILHLSKASYVRVSDMSVNVHCYFDCSKVTSWLHIYAHVFKLQMFVSQVDNGRNSAARDHTFNNHPEQVQCSLIKQL